MIPAERQGGESGRQDEDEDPRTLGTQPAQRRCTYECVEFVPKTRRGGATGQRKMISRTRSQEPEEKTIPVHGRKSPKSDEAPSTHKRGPTLYPSESKHPEAISSQGGR